MGLGLKTAVITARFASDIRDVWAIVTDNRDYAWRSDLARVEVSDGSRQFTEYTRSGFATTFTIILKEPYSRYGFDLENKFMRGRWTGDFRALPGGGTEIRFVEEIKVKNLFMRVLSSLFMDLKKMQQTYVRDLRQRLGE